MLFFAAIAVIGYLLYREPSSPQKVPQDEFAQTVEAVGKLIVLPVNETPTIATVANLDQIKNQPFFANAKVGDKVLIYAKAKKAILYDPSLNKIIELAPLDVGTMLNSTSSPQ